MDLQQIAIAGLRTLIVFPLLISMLVPAEASEPLTEGHATVMSLNIYGYKTMPREAGAFASLVKRYAVDVLAIQEGVDDWRIDMEWPEDYSRSEVLLEALGDCWERQFQVYANHCRGFSIEDHERFDLADGPNAVRTGEKAIIAATSGRFTLVNVHWDHQSESSRRTAARQTADAVGAGSGLPVVVLGDFNSPCIGPTVQGMVGEASLQTTVDGGIDCIFLRGIEGVGEVVDASPSDHPAVLVRLAFAGARD